MNNPMNLKVFTQTSFDSGLLSGLGGVLHRFDQPGEHRLTVFHADQPIQTARFSVRGTPQHLAQSTLHRKRLIPCILISVKY